MKAASIIFTILYFIVTAAGPSAVDLEKLNILWDDGEEVRAYFMARWPAHRCICLSGNVGVLRRY